jgi:hypothetical protein
LFCALEGRKTWTIKVNVPTKSKLPTTRTTAAPADFRRRYDELERRREQLMARLQLIGEFGTKHAAYGNARALLGRSFRKASVAQRLAVLESASWLIDLLEKLPAVL